MHIVHAILTSQFAGSERYALELAAHQARTHQVTLVLRKSACADSPRALRYRVAQNVKVEVVSDWFAGVQLRRFLKKTKPDIVHAHLSRACKALAKLKGVCPRVATLHIHYKPSQHQYLDGLIAIAPWQLTDIPEPLKTLSAQIDNWTLAQTGSSDDRQKLRERLGLSADAYLFGSLGRVEKSKGFDILLAAHQKQHNANSHLVVVGAGNELAKLAKQAHSNSHFVGFSENPAAWLAAFDCFVSSSRSEPFGLVMLEAMQAGLPIIASASQGAKHLAEKIRTALVAVGDVDTLAQAMRQMQQQGHRRITYDMSGFVIEQQALLVEQFYAQQIKQFDQARTSNAIKSG